MCVCVCVRKRYGKSCIITFIRDGNYNLKCVCSYERYISIWPKLFNYFYRATIWKLLFEVCVCVRVRDIHLYGKSCITTFIGQRDGNYNLDVCVRVRDMAKVI